MSHLLGSGDAFNGDAFNGDAFIGDAFNGDAFTGRDADPEPLTEPSAAAAEAARRRLAELPVGPGALGRLADLGVWAASVQGRCPPLPFLRVRILLLAGDHGIAAAAVSAHPPSATGQMVRAVASGGAAVNVLARATGATVRLLDLAVDSSVDSAVDRAAGMAEVRVEADSGADTEAGAGAGTPTEAAFRVRSGSGRIDREDALTHDEARQAFAAGTRIADDEVDGGADLLVPAELGVGASTPASVIVAALTGAEPVDAIGRGSGIDDDTWMRKLAAIRDALRRARGRVDPFVLLAVAGGADIAAMAGVLSQAAIRRTPVLIDGLVPAAAALVAREVTPGAEQWWLAGHRSPEPAQHLALSRLGLPPLLDLDASAGQGTGALLALLLLDAAIRLLGETAPWPEPA